MKFDDANALVRSYLAAYGAKDTGLNSDGKGGVRLGHLEVYFEFGSSLEPTNVLAWRANTKAPQKVLKANARIYTFLKEPSEALMRELKRAAKDESIDTANGAVVYQPENQGLFLSLQYEKAPEPARFKEEIDELLVVSGAWLEGTLEECMERARG